MYHLILRKSVPWTRSIENCRWAFAGFDPRNGHVNVGSLARRMARMFPTDYGWRKAPRHNFVTARLLRLFRRV